MSKPIVIYTKRSNDFTDEITLTKAELQRIVDTACKDKCKELIEYVLAEVVSDKTSSKELRSKMFEIFKRLL